MTKLPTPPLPDVIIEPIVRLALSEDLGRAGDLTTDVTIPADTRMVAIVNAREPGIAAGYDAARLAARLVDADLKFDVLNAEGTYFEKGTELIKLEGFARSILTAERMILNFIGPLSGVATLTHKFVQETLGTHAQIVCTRKTTPGFRALEKRAVRLGGGVNHRLGLDDAILIKDNHIAAAGSISAVLERAKASVGHLCSIEIEVDTLDQLKEALPHKPHAVLLDNMSTDTLREAVKMIDGSCKAEASGGVNLKTVRGIAETGVDFISVGALTHSAVNLDVGLDYQD
jgi:nicotinate-nucleotide pyrophosphorylase (carboxylating)